MAKKSINQELETVLSNIDKKYGEGAIVKVSETEIKHIPVVSTGSLSLNHALGVGGYPLNRITEIYGPESSGKTTLCIHAIVEGQKKFPDRQVAFVDMEHALDIAYTEALGADLDRLYVSQPDTGEQALEITEALVRSGQFSVVVVDSVAALVPKAEIEGEMGDAQVGRQARLMSQAMRKISPALKSNDIDRSCALIFTNQIRMKIGVMFGNPETTSGGNALKFYSSIRLDVRKTATVKDAEKVSLSNTTRVKVVKNKVAPPFREAILDIEFGKGIDLASELITLGLEYNILVKRGAFFSYNDNRLGQGAVNTKKYISEHPELASELTEKIEQAIASGVEKQVVIKSDTDLSEE